MAGEIKTLQFTDGTATTPTITELDVGTPDGTVASRATNVGYVGTTLGLTKNKNDTVNPVGTDDSASGFSIGSRWFNTASKVSFIASDVSVGSAIWNEFVTAEATAQSIDGIKTFTDTTDATTKDTGGVVLQGGIGVEKNVHAGGTIKNDNTTEASSPTTGSIVTPGGLGVGKNAHLGGNLVVVGDMTIQGDTTTLNTATLDVEDVNITINKGGNEATAFR